MESYSQWKSEDTILVEEVRAMNKVMPKTQKQHETAARGFVSFLFKNVLSLYLLLLLLSFFFVMYLLDREIFQSKRT